MDSMTSANFPDIDAGHSMSFYAVLFFFIVYSGRSCISGGGAGSTAEWATAAPTLSAVTLECKNLQIFISNKLHRDSYHELVGATAAALRA